MSSNALVDRYLLYRGGDPADHAALSAYTERASLRNFRVLMLINIACNVIWGLSDPLTTRSVPELLPGLLRWRLASILLALAFYFVLDRVRWFERHAALTLALLFFAFMTVNLWSVWPLGGLDTPLPDAGYLVPLISVLALVPLPTRVALVALITAGWQITYFAVEPGALESPYVGITLALLLFAAFCGVVLGHITYHLTRENFLISRRLEGFNAGLQAEVDRRTQELRALANRLVDLRESERSHLARELHDQSGQLVSGMRLELDALALRAARSPDTAAELEPGLARLGGLLDALLDGLRRILRDLRPKLLDDLGLPAALTWLARSTSEAGPLTVTASVDESLAKLPPPVAMALFRIAQEALTNAVRHAEAESVHLELARVEELVVLRVHDDGRGLSDDRRRGLGLLGMHERARSIAGTLELGVGPSGRGVCVELRVDPRSAQ